MHYVPKHSAARKDHLLRNRVVGAAVAASSTLAAGVFFSPPAQAADSVWDRVAACESGGNWATNSGNGFSGGLQFTASTWNLYGGSGYAARPHLASKAAQIITAQRVLAAQGPGAWPVCGVRAHLTRASGGAASSPRVAQTVSRSMTRKAIVVRTPLVLDGIWGPKTAGAFQHWIGTPNGVFRVRSVKALQRKLGIAPVGRMGPQTIRALQAKIGVRQDGAGPLSTATVLGLQRYLNAH